MKTNNHLFIVYDIRSSREIDENYYYNYDDNHHRRSYLKWKKYINIYEDIKNNLIRKFKRQFNNSFKKEFNKRNYFLSIIFDHKITYITTFPFKKEFVISTIMKIVLVENKKRIHEQQFVLINELKYSKNINCMEVEIDKTTSKIIQDSINILSLIFRGE